MIVGRLGFHTDRLTTSTACENGGGVGPQLEVAIDHADQVEALSRLQVHVFAKYMSTKSYVHVTVNLHKSLRRVRLCNDVEVGGKRVTLGRLDNTIRAGEGRTGKKEREGGG